MKQDIATVDALLVSLPDGSSELIPAKSSVCKSCGICGSSASSIEHTGVLRSERLTISLPSRSLVWIAIGMYGVPFLGLIAGTLLAAVLGAGDLIAALCALAGCLAGVVPGGRFMRRLEREAAAALGPVSLREPVRRADSPARRLSVRTVE